MPIPDQVCSDDDLREDDPVQYAVLAITELVMCFYCHGSGDDPDGGEPECPICDGSGERRVLHYREDDREDYQL